MIIWFTPRQTTNPPKMDVFPKTFLQIILAATVIGYSAAFKYIRQTAVTTFAFSSPCFFFYSSASILDWGIIEHAGLKAGQLVRSPIVSLLRQLWPDG